MNLYMNRVALAAFSSFDAGTKPSEDAEPELCEARASHFYHGFVLGLMVDLTDNYAITSNRESGFGRYDILLEPKIIATNDNVAVNNHNENTVTSNCDKDAITNNRSRDAIIIEFKE